MAYFANRYGEIGPYYRWSGNSWWYLAGNGLGGTYVNPKIEPLYLVDEHCEEPAVANPNATNANNACMVSCPADRPFNTTIRDCQPEQAASQSCEAQAGNPINFVTGDKYLIETDYRGVGAYPLEITRYYNSHNNREYTGRSGWSQPVSGVPTPPPRVIYYEPKITTSQPRNFSVDNLTSPEPLYTGRNAEHWRFSFDSFLLASFSVYDTSYTTPPGVIKLTYDTLGHLLTLTETDTTVRNIPYSTNGQSRTTTFTYHAAGTNGALQVASVDGPRTDVADITQYSYTAAGHLNKVINALGHEIEITSHNEHGLPLTFVDENEVLTTLTYHPRGWLLSSTVEGGTAPDAVTSYSYDAAGQVTRITLPDGTYLDYAYDEAHRLVGVSNNLGEEINYMLDNAGNVTQEEIVDASAQIKRTQTQAFDELSRLRSSTGGSNQLTRFSYDTNDNLVLREADPNGLDQTTGRAFDGLDRLITSTDALDGAADYFYDKRDNLTGVIDERGLLTNYVYDGFDNLIMRDSPDSGTTVYTYDKAGNVISEKDGRGIQKTFTYDELGRVTFEHYPDDVGEDIEYRYDASGAGHGIGRLTSVEDPSGTTSFTYDHRGNQLSSTVTVQSSTYTTLFAYDLADNLIQTVYPSGRVVHHVRDALGRVGGITTRTSGASPLVDVVSDVEYLPFGPVSSMVYGNDLETTLSYDQDYRLTGIETADDTNSNSDVLNLSYDLNAVNNIEDIDNNLDANRSQSFAYDLLNRLIEADGIYGLLEYDYDAVGNRLEESRTVGSNSVTYTYTYYAGSNSIESISDGTNFRFYLYDGNGNVRSDGNNLYRFNRQNRLIEVAP